MSSYSPPYCPGFGIIYSADVIEQLYNKAQTSRYFWIDDVYVTGILSSELNIPITTGKDLFLKPKETLDVLSNDIDQAKKLKLKFLFAKPDLTASEIRKLWNVFMDTRVNWNWETTWKWIIILNNIEKNPLLGLLKSKSLNYI